MSEWKIIESDVLEALKAMPSDSFDGCETDPPYGLGAREPTGEEIVAYLQGDSLNTRGDFMGKNWQLPPIAVWRELLRVLKPGASAIVFGAPRMADLLSIGLRAAGFQVNDVLMWMYASAMPKSLNLERAVSMKTCKLPGRHFGANLPKNGKKEGDHICPMTPEGAEFQGIGTGLKPAYEPAILVQKPIVGTYAANALARGTGGIDINGCRVGYADEEDRDQMAAGVDAIRERGGVMNNSWKNSSDLSGANPANPLGRFPSNVVMSHTESCRIVGVQVIRGRSDTDVRGTRPSGFGNVGTESGSSTHNGPVYGDERIPIYECPPDCPVAMLDAQSGDRPGMTGGGAHSAEYSGGMFGAIDSTGTARGDSGGASRFFFTSKASRAEREFGCEHLPARTGAEAVEREEDSHGVNNPRAGAGRSAKEVRNYHPCVKDISACKYFATLIRPPYRGKPRRILVLYSGSGSEMIAAMRAGWEEIVGIEREGESSKEKYTRIAKARLARWAQVPMQMDEGEAVGEARVELKKQDPRQSTLFDLITPTMAKLAMPISSQLVATAIPAETVVVPPPVVQTPVVVSAPPVITAGLGSEMPFSELAQKLKERGWSFTLQEIAGWTRERREKAAKWLRNEK